MPPSKPKSPPAKVKLQKQQALIRTEIKQTYLTIDATHYRRLAIKDLTIQLEIDAIDIDTRGYRPSRDLAAVYQAGAELISWTPSAEVATHEDGWDDVAEANADISPPKAPRDNRGIGAPKIRKAVELMAQGVSHPQIAATLGIAQRTVSSIRKRYVVEAHPIPEDVV